MVPVQFNIVEGNRAMGMEASQEFLGMCMVMSNDIMSTSLDDTRSKVLEQSAGSRSLEHLKVMGRRHRPQLDGLFREGLSEVCPDLGMVNLWFIDSEAHVLQEEVTD
jgi:hypothetical protein